MPPLLRDKPPSHVKRTRRFICILLHQHAGQQSAPHHILIYFVLDFLVAKPPLFLLFLWHRFDLIVEALVKDMQIEHFKGALNKPWQYLPRTLLMHAKHFEFIDYMIGQQVFANITAIDPLATRWTSVVGFAPDLQAFETKSMTESVWQYPQKRRVGSWNTYIHIEHFNTAEIEEFFLNLRFYLATIGKSVSFFFDLFIQTFINFNMEASIQSKASKHNHWNRWRFCLLRALSFNWSHYFRWHFFFLLFLLFSRVTSITFWRLGWSHHFFSVMLNLSVDLIDHGVRIDIVLFVMFKAMFLVDIFFGAYW